jgi:hypothetical protein
MWEVAEMKTDVSVSGERSIEYTADGRFLTIHIVPDQVHFRQH